MQTVPRNIPLQILDSQIMMAILSAVIAPVIVSVLKERFDIQIEASQVQMIMNDGIKAVKLYQNESSRLRDENGRIPPEYQTKLRDLAFDSIKSNYTLDKYESVISKVGPQVFEKAIEAAVKRNWIERFPLENKQVEEMIKQAIDALPQIVEWKNLDEDVKVAFLEGHVKKLLSTIGIEGWGITKLNEVFEAEANKRIMSAAIADARGLLQKLDSNGSSKYLRYTEAILNGTAEAIK